jgi:hypothetical protein
MLILQNVIYASKNEVTDVPLQTWIKHLQKTTNDLSCSNFYISYLWSSGKYQIILKCLSHVCYFILCCKCSVQYVHVKGEPIYCGSTWVTRIRVREPFLKNNRLLSWNQNRLLLQPPKVAMTQLYCEYTPLVENNALDRYNDISKKISETWNVMWETNGTIMNVTELDYFCNSVSQWQ